MKDNLIKREIIMKFRILTFLSIALLFMSCSILSSNSHSPQIVGQWEWVRSSGGIMGETKTPDSTGVPERHLNFNVDQSFSFYRADTLVQKGRFSLNEKGEDLIISYHTADNHFFMDQRLTFQGNDTLILADECYDCYINMYVRAR